MLTHPWYELTEHQLLVELGQRLKQTRLNLNLTQEEVGRRIGKDRFEISKIENGKAISLVSFLRVLRALEKLDSLDQAIPYPPVSPRELALLEEKKAKRARRK